jgi:glutamyl-tRNA reductase
MSILCVGISHRSAPVAVLETVALDSDGAAKLAHAAAETEHVLEAVVVSTCNRVEVYAEVDRFHGSVEDVSGLMCDLAGGDRAELVSYLYVHYDEGALAHLFAVTAGLDSMVVGESQILGQVRVALTRGQDDGTVGPALNSAFQRALRVGKRGHAETGIDQAGPSVVRAALDRVEAAGTPVRGARALVVGAGSMAGLAVAHLDRRGASSLVVVNRTADRAARLAAPVGGGSAGLDTLAEQIAAADVVVTCTGATGVVIGADTVARALAARPDASRIAVVDLALPHDVDPAVAELPGVTLIDLARLAEVVNHSEGATDVAAVRGIVAEEIIAFLAARSSATVTPTVVALRSMATGIVDAEMGRLSARLPDLDPAVRSEVEHAVRRVADKLLHQPTVRVKELANETGTVSYATALAELFSLDPDAVTAVTRAEGM